MIRLYTISLKWFDIQKYKIAKKQFIFDISNIDNNNYSLIKHDISVC